MGVSVYPVLNKEVPRFDVTEASGKALADAIFEQGSAFAVLERFNSQNAEELADFIADQTGQEASEIEVPAEEWFAPQDGLQVVRLLLDQLSSSSLPGSAIPPAGWAPGGYYSEALTDDLQNLEKALLLAQEHDALFHLEMDF